MCLGINDHVWLTNTTSSFYLIKLSKQGLMLITWSVLPAKLRKVPESTGRQDPFPLNSSAQLRLSLITLTD